VFLIVNQIRNIEINYYSSITILIYINRKTINLLLTIYVKFYYSNNKIIYYTVSKAYCIVILRSNDFNEKSLNQFYLTRSSEYI